MTSKPQHLYEICYVGAHYSLCPVELRELWTKAFDNQDGRLLLAQIAKRHFAAHSTPESFGVVPLFTCNRFDICISAKPSDEALLEFFKELGTEALKLLSSRPEKHDKELGAASRFAHGNEMRAGPKAELHEILTSPPKLKSVLRFKQGQEALLQLFRVACSLDSLVLGEPHILGQIKEQFFVARDLQVTGKKIEHYFAKCFAIAKKVRTETDLGRNGVSIGHAAVLLVTRIFDDLSKRSALVIGAGEMGRLAAQHLINQKIGSLTLANRTLAHAMQLAHDLGSGKALELSVALSQLTTFDVIIVATSSRETFVHKMHFENFDRQRRGSPAVVVDVSVPRNVDIACAKVSESLFVFDVDDLDKVMEKNREQRREAALAAERIIYDELIQFSHAQIQRDNLVLVGKFHQLVRKYVLLELKKSARKKQSRNQLALREEERFEIIADAVAKRLVSKPAELARNNSQLDEELLKSVGEILHELFDLNQVAENNAHSTFEATAQKVIPLVNQAKGN